MASVVNAAAKREAYLALVAKTAVANALVAATAAMP